MDYYRFKIEYEENISFFLLLLGLFIGVMFYNWNQAVGVVIWITFVIISFIISEEGFFVFLKFSINYIGIFLGIVIVVSWWFGDTLFGQEISDNRMVVIVTMVWVVLTYHIFNQNKEIFKQGRLPRLIVYEDYHRRFMYNFKNSGTYDARDLFIDFYIVYPSPHNLWGSLKYKIRNRHKMPKVTIEFLEPDEEDNIDISKDVLERINLKYKKNDMEEFGYYVADTKIKFEILVSYTYSSQDGFLAPKMYKLFRYSGNETIVALERSSKPKRLSP